MIIIKIIFLYLFIGSIASFFEQHRSKNEEAYKQLEHKYGIILYISMIIFWPIFIDLWIRELKFCIQIRILKYRFRKSKKTKSKSK